MPGSIGSLFGGGSDTPQFPTQISARTPGYNLSSAAGDNNVIKTNLRRSGAVNEAFDQRFPRVLSDLDALRGTVRPGFSDLRLAKRQQIENARSKAIGNLRDAFAQRRLSGSSFALDKIVQAEREFGQAQALSEAEAYTQELEASRVLLSQESAVMSDAMNRELQELGIASGISQNMASLISQNLQYSANLEAQEDAAKGQGIGNLLGLGLSLATGNLGGSLLGKVFNISGTPQVPAGRA